MSTERNRGLWMFALLVLVALLMGVGVLWPGIGAATTWQDLDSDRQPLSFALLDSALLFENPWNSTAKEAGAFSQQDQVLAGAFSLTSAASVTRATWHGTMYSRDPLDTGDIWPFRITFFQFAPESGMPGAPLYSTVLDAAVTDTGIDIQLTPSIDPERAYLFDASFSGVPLLGGDRYFFSVVNVSTPNTFRWNSGTNMLYSGFLSTDYSSSSDVPEPATLLLLATGLVGLGGVAWRRHRRG